MTIASSVKTIGNSAFYGCSALASLDLPEGVTSLGSLMLGGTAVSDLTIPSTAASASGALTGCPYLESVEFASGTTKIPDSIFYQSGQTSYMKTVTIPASVTEIGGSAFNGCAALADAYYGGASEDDWNAMTIGSSNDPLTAATRHYAGQ